MKTESKELRVSARLKKMRIDAEMTQDQLASKAGLERKTINRIENGHFSPNLSSLIRICNALKVKPSQVLEGI
jgi:DNA-binding XRE family transcriptional regulator